MLVKLIQGPWSASLSAVHTDEEFCDFDELTAGQQVAAGTVGAVAAGLPASGGGATLARRPPDLHGVQLRRDR
jgi:hypothetical protein